MMDWLRRLIEAAKAPADAADRASGVAQERTGSGLNG